MEIFESGDQRVLETHVMIVLEEAEKKHFCQEISDYDSLLHL